MRPTLPQKFHLAYHLVIGGGLLWTPLLGASIAPEALHRCAQAHGAWTDVGKNAVVRRAAVRRSDTFSHVLSHLGVDPAVQLYPLSPTPPYGGRDSRTHAKRRRATTAHGAVTPIFPPLGPGGFEVEVGARFEGGLTAPLRRI